MKPIIAYFITGDFEGEHVIAMEDKIADMYPDRDTDVIHVEDEEQKYRLLSTYNIEELDPYLGDILWEAIEDDCDDDL